MLLDGGWVSSSCCLRERCVVIRVCALHQFVLLSRNTRLSRLTVYLSNLNANIITHVQSHVHTLTHSHTHILLQPLAVMHTGQSLDVCALSRHCEPCKQSSWSWAKNSQEKGLFPHSKWCGHPKSHLRNFAPQQMPGTQSQLGGLVGLVGGRWKSCMRA